MDATPNHSRSKRAEAISDIGFALLLIVAAGVVAGWLSRWLITTFDLPMLLLVLVQGLLVLLGLQALLTYRGRSWHSLRLQRPRPTDAARALVALALAFALNAAVSLLGAGLFPGALESHQQGLTGVAQLLAGELSLATVAASMMFVGFYEELLARGFLLRRCEALLGGSWGAVVLSSVLFGLGHFYQGWLGVAQTALLGVLFASLTLRWQTLWPLIFAHAALNTVSLLALRQLTGA